MIALRRTWRSETGLLIGVAGVATIVFAATPLDLAAARLFYRPQGPDHWPLGILWPARVLYQLAPLITASLVLLGLAGFLVDQLRPSDALRRNCLFLTLSLLLGPGLLVNAVLKDHWHRPRPRDVVQFGGPLQYTPPPLRGEGGGSFPCGHCSVGFLYGIGWWVWKHGRRRWARASLALGLGLGSMLGIGRMAAGAHFLSDVVWSALLALGVAHLVHECVLPLAETAIARLAIVKPRIPAKQILTVCASLGAIAILLGLFVTPHGNLFSLRVDLSSLPVPPRVLDVTAVTANVQIVIEDSDSAQLLAEGELHGFGLPGSRLAATTTFRRVPVPTVAVRFEEQGWITDLSAFATIHLPLGALQRVVVRLHKGDIQMIDATSEHAIARGAVGLQLKTDSGSVQVR